MSIAHLLWQAIEFIQINGIGWTYSMAFIEKREEVAFRLLPSIV
jgi:hypothetical protein